MAKHMHFCVAYFPCLLLRNTYTPMQYLTILHSHQYHCTKVIGVCVCVTEDQQKPFDSELNAGLSLD